MAQIVCIAEGTFKDGINNLDDIVAIHDDDVDLTGKAYDTFKVYSVKGVTAKEVQEKFSVIQPEVKRFWIDTDGAMYELKSAPKYPVSMVTIDSTDEVKLVDTKLDSSTILGVLDKVQFNLKILSDNKETELTVKTITAEK